MKVTVKMEGHYNVNSTHKWSVCPAKMKVVKIKKTGKGRIKVSWKKQTKVSGYKIVYVTNKKMTKNKKVITVNKASATSKIIKKLKSGKKYYIKVCAFKKNYR